MPSLGKKASHLQPFQDLYAAKYALQVTRRSIVDGVREVECRMCRAFGHEESDAAVGSKRKLQSEVKSWAGPQFRSDYFLRHLKSQHEEHWAIYQTLQSEQEKERYLQVEEGEEEQKAAIIKDEKEHFKEEEQEEKEEALQFEETDDAQNGFVAALERATRVGREKLLAAVTEITANQRKSAEALRTMISNMQTDYLSLRQRELEVRDRELKSLEAERRERQEERKTLHELEQAGHREREEERKAEHERFLALLSTMHTE